MQKQRKRSIGGGGEGSSEFVNKTDERPGIDDLVESAEAVKRKKEVDDLFRAILASKRKPRRVDSCGC